MAWSFVSDNHTYEKLKAICLEYSKLGERAPSPALENTFFGPSPSQVLYTLEVCILIMFLLLFIKF